MSTETRARLEQEIMLMPTPLNSIGDQLYLLAPFDNAPRIGSAQPSDTHGEVLRTPVWLAQDDLQRFLNGLPVANFRSVANMRHTTVYPSAQLAAIMAFYTAQEVEEIRHAVRDTAPTSGLTTVSALTSDPGGSYDSLMEDAIDEAPRLSPESAANVQEILFRPLYRRYNTRLDAFVLASNPEMVVDDQSPPPQPIRSGAWTSLSAHGLPEYD
jgi:hypothetical protein